MTLIHEYKITPLYLKPGDTISVNYNYTDDAGQHRWANLTIDTIEQAQMVDTLLAFKIAPGEYGLRAGRALVLGEDAGGRLTMPTTTPRQVILGGRTTDL